MRHKIIFFSHLNSTRRLRFVIDFICSLLSTNNNIFTKIQIQLTDCFFFFSAASFNNEVLDFQLFQRNRIHSPFYAATRIQHRIITAAVFLPPIFPLKAASLRKGAWLIVLNNANETQKRKQSEFRYLRHSKLVKNSIKIRFNLYLAFQSTNDIRTEDLWLLTKLDKCTTIFPSFHPFTLCRGRRFANKRFLRDEIYAVQMEQQKFLLGHAHSSGMSENNDEISSNFQFRLESERERELKKSMNRIMCGILQRI